MSQPFLTTVVGSMPKPAWLMEQVPLNEAGKQVHGKGADWGFSGHLLADAMDDATREVSRMKIADAKLAHVLRRRCGLGNSDARNWILPTKQQVVNGWRI